MAFLRYFCGYFRYTFEIKCTSETAVGKRNRLLVNVNPVNWVNLGVSRVDMKLHVFKVLGEDNVRPSQGGADTCDVHQEHDVVNAEFRFVAS